MMINMNGQSGVGALTGAGASRPARLPLWLADEIEEHMLEGEFIVDAQLPTETALSESYGVSRQVVREAARRTSRPSSAATAACCAATGRASCI